ncbi:MAG: sigma-70 family RNA polymerase sigma factor [Planctomycetes bacterium]|nr:sigma-70 family RNA polymerase sigma factor [Planctomycetota bacterium]
MARDVVQEAFLAAYRDLRKLRDPARFAGWLRGIVRHTAHRALREMEQVRRLAEELQRAPEPVAPPSDQSAEDAERRELVRRALGELSEKNREAVSLYYVDGFSYAEIAGFLGVTEATVLGRLQRARAQLRKELAMVKDTFKKQELPRDFSDEIKRLLDSVAAESQERQAAVKRLAEIGAPAVDPLCEAMSDSRLPVRQVAAHALCAIADPRALRPMLRLLYSEWHEGGWWAERSFFCSGKPLAIPGVREALLGIIREGKWVQQWVAFHALSHAKGDTEVFETVRGIFQDVSRPAQSRHGALAALCRLAPESAAGFIAVALNGPDLRLRSDAAWLAVRGGFLPPVAACLNAFGSDMGWWGRVCAGALVLKHGEPGKQALERIMRTGSAAGRCTAAMALARTGSAEAFDVLKQGLLGGGDRNWAKAVSRTLASRYGRKLTEWVEGEKPRLADVPALIWTLAKSAPAQAGPMVQELYREGTSSVRAASARILARQRGAEFLPELRRCLREGSPRKLAQEAFWQVHRLGEAAMPTVSEMLTSERWTERKAAVCLLRRWGKLTAEQRKRAQADPHVAVRHAADRLVRGNAAAVESRPTASS